MLPKLTDWRWKTKGEKTYCYDSLEIIRQERQENGKEPTLILKEKISKNIQNKEKTHLKIYSVRYFKNKTIKSL